MPDACPRRCLLVTKEFSLIPTSGGMLRTLAMAGQLCTRFDTTVISPAGVWRGGPDQVLQPGPGTHRDAAGAGGRWRVLTVSDLARYRSISGVRTGGRALLRNIAGVAGGHYDLGVLDHTCLAGLADAMAAGCTEVVISMHNLESDLMAQRAAAATDPRSRVLMRVETQLLRRLENQVVRRYPVMVTTDADARELASSRARVIVCRNGIFPTRAEPVDRPPGHTMVFSGALDWEPNIAGLVWFAGQVWPLVRERLPEAVVTVAGRRPGPAVRAACDRPGIDLRPDVPVMTAVLAEHPLGIVPLLSGGGSRIKILEYLDAGMDVVSTEVGAAGLEDIPDELVDRVPAEPGRFADQVVERLRRPRHHGPAAQEWVRENYAWAVTLQPLLAAVDPVRTGSARP